MQKMEVSREYSQSPLTPHYQPAIPCRTLEPTHLQNLEPGLENQIDQFFNIQQNLPSTTSALAFPTENSAEMSDSTVLTKEKIVQDCLDLYFNEYREYVEIYVVSKQTPVFPFGKLQEAHQYSLCYCLEQFDNLCKNFTCLPLDNHEYDILKQQLISKAQEIHLHFESKNHSQVSKLVNRLVDEQQTKFEARITNRFSKLFNSSSSSVVNRESISGVNFYVQEPLAKYIEDLTSNYISRCNADKTNLVERQILQNESDAQYCQQFQKAKQRFKEYGHSVLHKNLRNETLVKECLNQMVSEEYELQYSILAKTIQTEVFFGKLSSSIAKITKTITSQILFILAGSSVDGCPKFEQHMQTVLQDKANKFRLSCEQCSEEAQLKAVTEYSECSKNILKIPDLANMMTEDQFLSKHPESFANILLKNLQKAYLKSQKEYHKKHGSTGTKQSPDEISLNALDHSNLSANIGCKNGLDSDTTRILPRNDGNIKSEKRKHDQQDSSQRNRSKRSSKS